ncbi:uncharacterized protein scimp [Centroberyx gerrardi]|uniref:uncharacterized protein n=1 Tax=Centroberyx gerrardi TaxID=166262 RepID=UPI003AABA2B4
MDLLRKYIWLWVIIGIIFVSLVICLIFILINKCLSEDAESRTLRPHNGHEYYTQSSKYHPKDLGEDVPPLPPRTQFLTAEAQSYENLAELPDYVKVEDEVMLPPPPPYQYSAPAADCSADNVSTEDYDDIGAEEGEEDYDDVG